MSNSIFEMYHRYDGSHVAHLWHEVPQSRLPGLCAGGGGLFGHLQVPENGGLLLRFLQHLLQKTFQNENVQQYFV